MNYYLFRIVEEHDSSTHITAKGNRDRHVTSPVPWEFVIRNVYIDKILSFIYLLAKNIRLHLQQYKTGLF